MSTAINYDRGKKKVMKITEMVIYSSTKEVKLIGKENGKLDVVEVDMNYVVNQRPMVGGYYVEDEHGIKSYIPKKKKPTINET